MRWRLGKTLTMPDVVAVVRALPAPAGRVEDRGVLAIVGEGADDVQKVSTT